MSDVESGSVVGQVNGRIIIRTVALFATGFNVYRPTDDPTTWAKENSPMSAFTTYQAAAAWADRQPPIKLLDTPPETG